MIGKRNAREGYWDNTSVNRGICGVNISHLKKSPFFRYFSKNEFHFSNCRLHYIFVHHNGRLNKQYEISSVHKVYVPRLLHLLLLLLLLIPVTITSRHF